MPLVGIVLKQQMQTRIANSLASVFAKEGQTDEAAQESWNKIADAISDIAIDIVNALHNDAQVAPGIAIVGVGGGVPGPVSGETVSPGQIL